MKENSSNAEDSFMFSRDTISSVLQTDLPDDNIFRFLLPEKCTFDLPEDIWNSLCANQKGRCFPRNSWEDQFLKGVRESNPHCVFSFKHHRVSVAEQRPKSLMRPFFMLKDFVNLKKSCVTVKAAYSVTFDIFILKNNVSIFKNTVNILKFRYTFYLFRNN